MKRMWLIFLLGLAFAAAATAQSISAGAKIENFSMPDTTGKISSLNDMKGKNGAVIIFVSTQCPVVRGYNERMNQLALDYGAKGINVIGVNSNATESPDQVKAHAAATFKFPVLIDKGSSLADKLGAGVTPEAYYIDASNVLLYHGAIDNDRSGGNITEPYLRAAIEAGLAGKKVPRASANAFGCSIRRTAD